MRALTKEAEDLRVIIEENRYKKRQVIEGGKVDGSNVTYYDLISENIDEVKKIRNNKREKLDRLAHLKERFNQLDLQKQNILKLVPRNYHSLSDL